jgi:hypothetical protein
MLRGREMEAWEAWKETFGKNPPCRQGTGLPKFIIVAMSHKY